MRRIALLILLTAPLLCEAQSFPNFSEWFKQKKTRKKYMVAQIAALQSYLVVLQKGYKICQQGLTAISDFKNGEYGLHRDFFTSLSNINPKIGNAARVADILAMQTQINANFRRLIKLCNKDGHFSAEEIHYVSIVFTGVMQSCDNAMAQLVAIVTSDKFKMEDEERLRAINKIYQDTQDRYLFTEDFGDQTMLLAQNRARDLNDIHLRTQLE